MVETHYTLMSGRKNHYQILGISSDVTPAEIKRAYRRLAKMQHPDAQGTNGAAEAATEEMMRLNDAYETLMDADKRAEYDRRIGLGRLKGIFKPVLDALDEDAEREKYLRLVFHPARSRVAKVLSRYKQQLRDLSADPYDDRLIEQFQVYLDGIEHALRKSSDALARNHAPRSMEAAIHMMRHSIAQAADGLEELRDFCMNYDYHHLTTAGSLFKIAGDLSKQAQELTKTG
jgi:molecular chaperone DnaJ